MLNYHHVSLDEQLRYPSIQEAVDFQRATFVTTPPTLPPDMNLQKLALTVPLSLQGKGTRLRWFEEKALDKWWGPQGHSSSYEMVEPKLLPYYENLDVKDFYQFSPRTFEFLFSFSNRPLLRVLRPSEAYSRWKPKAKSLSGVYTWCDRRSLDARKAAARVGLSRGATYGDNPDMAVLGQKNERNKLRTIFMTTFEDQLTGMQTWASLHEHLSSNPCIAWRGTQAVEADLWEFMKRNSTDLVFFESDYESMDTWVSLEHAHALVRALAPYATNEWMACARSYVEASFTSPLLTPKGVVRQKHNLFSGLYLTNDIESYLNVDITLEFLLSQVRWKVVSPRFGVDYVFVVLGDDVLVILKKSSMATDPDDLPSLFSKFAWAHARIRARADKQRVSFEDGWFCKRNYCPRNKVVNDVASSIYPLTLALNSIDHPRDGSPFTKDAYGVVRAASILDNSPAHPLWKRVVDDVKRLRFPDLFDENRLKEAEEQFNARCRNWKILLYGQRFSIASSPTLQRWYSIG